MTDLGDDVRELKIKLQLYEAEFAAQAAEIQKLRQENVGLKAKVAYMEQKRDKQVSSSPPRSQSVNAEAAAPAAHAVLAAAGMLALLCASVYPLTVLYSRVCLSTYGHCPSTAQLRICATHMATSHGSCPQSSDA